MVCKVFTDCFFVYFENDEMLNLWFGETFPRQQKFDYFNYNKGMYLIHGWSGFHDFEHLVISNCIRVY